MSDCELLELAAKAHGGIPAAVVGAEPGYYWCGATCAPQWNPLTDDGDALRLAVKLRLWVRDGEAQDGHDIYAAEDGDDPYAATRRAIVRAAAEIGRGMVGSNKGLADSPEKRHNRGTHDDDESEDRTSSEAHAGGG